MTNDETACPFCGGETLLVTESASDRYRKQRRECKECGSPFLAYVEKKQAQRCNVPGCTERGRCLDEDSPQRCALYRMMNRKLNVKK